MKKLLVFLSTLILTITSAGILTSAVNAQEYGDSIKKKIADFYEARSQEMKISNELTGMRSINICINFYTIDYKEGDPHINVGERFLLVGPNPVSGIWQISPVGNGHSWELGHYQAIPTLDANIFDMWNVGVKSESDSHYYRMEVEWGEDNCPDYVVFHSLAHGTSATNLHPGHAGGGR